MIEPWQDPANYEEGPIVKCLECGQRCHKTKWGNWCFKCNVKRIERIDAAFNSIRGL